MSKVTSITLYLPDGTHTWYPNIYQIVSYTKDMIEFRLRTRTAVSFITTDYTSNLPYLIREEENEVLEPKDL